MMESITNKIREWLTPKGLVERLATKKLVNYLRSSDPGALTRRNRTTPETFVGDYRQSGNLTRLRNRSWDAWRRNPHGRKIGRTISSQVMGSGLTPQFLAEDVEGTRDDEIRADCDRLWMLFAKNCHPWNKVGAGGYNWRQLCDQMARELVFSGELFLRHVKLTNSEKKSTGRKVRYGVEIIESERLPDTDRVTSEAAPGNKIFRGIELDPNGRRVAYHIEKANSDHPSYRNLWKTDTVRVPVDDITHVYVSDRPSQIRGVPLTEPILDRLREIADYEENELIASLVAACATLVVTRRSGAGRLSLNTPTNEDSTDANDNQISRLQPGTMITIADGDKVEGFNPGRPNTGTEGFVNHMLRGVATAMPGVKSSTLIGDYRESSFSSEKAADNDCWEETRWLQNFFAAYCQIIWENLLEVAVMDGFFKGLSIQDLEEDEGYKSAQWNGPVPKSINPKDDADAAGELITLSLSSVQDECAKLGVNWRDVLKKKADFQKAKSEYGIEEPNAETYGLMGVAAQQAGGANPGANAGEDDDQGNEPPPPKPKRGSPHNRLGYLNGSARPHVGLGAV